jgi:hypothetical protein
MQPAAHSPDVRSLPQSGNADFTMSRAILPASLVACPDPIG